MNNEIKEKREMKEKWERRIRGNFSRTTNEYGAEFRIPFDDELMKWKGRKEITAILSYNEGNKGNATPTDVNEQSFQRWFENGTFEELIADFISLRKKVGAERAKRSNERSVATEMISSESGYRERVYHFFTTTSTGFKYTDADDEWIFKRLFRDNTLSGACNLYIDLREKLYRIEFSPNANNERVMLGLSTQVDTQFWPEFFKVFGNEIDGWCRKISEVVESSDNEKSIESELLGAGIPRLFLECMCLRVTERGIVTEKGGTVWVRDGISTALNTSDKSASQFSIPNLAKVFASNLMKPVDITRVPIIPQFSNVPGEKCINYIKSYQPVERDDEPQLPTNWKRFLGNGRFYDEYMDRMKIACFVTNTLNAKYTGRQVLVLGGAGHDGKGVFLDTLGQIVGRDITCNVPFSAFDNADQFQLASVVNKKFVYLSDCKKVSTLFNQDKFKSLTGGDMQSINRKYLTSVNFVPQGLTMAVATNNKFYLTEEHGRTRCMPIVFRKNFSESQIIDRSDMVVSLLAEREEFLQWCADYRAWLNRKCKGNLLRKNLLVMCSDEDMKRVADGEYDELELFKNMSEKQLLNDEKFVKFNEKSEEDEIDEIDFTVELDRWIRDSLKEKWSGLKAGGFEDGGRTFVRIVKILDAFNDDLMDTNLGNRIKKYFPNDIRGGFKTRGESGHLFFAAMRKIAEAKGKYLKRKMVGGLLLVDSVSFADDEIGKPFAAYEREVVKPKFEMEAKPKFDFSGIA